MSFISNAFADTVTTSATHNAGGFDFMAFLPMIIIFVLFWFLLIRPQQKKAKQHNQMVSELQKGDEVITNGGIVGKISKIADAFIMLEVADGVIITVQKSTIGGKLEKGTLQSIGK